MKSGKRIIAVLLCFVVLCTAFAGCKKQEKSSASLSKNEYPVTVGGTEIKAMPERVIVLSENIADVILALGYESVLKGKSAECTQSELSVLPDVSLDDPDEIKKLSPDLILVDSEPQNSEDFAMKGIPVVAIAPAKDRADFERLYKEVGTALRGRDTGASFAQQRASDIFVSVDDVKRSVPASTVLITACYLFDLQGNAVTGDMLAGKLITSAGVSNAFEGSNAGDVVPETLKIADPDYIFCATGLKNQIMSSEDFSGLRAVTNGNVYEIDASYMRRQGRTVMQTVSLIHDVVYGDPNNNTDTPNPQNPTESGNENGNSSIESGISGEIKYGDISDDVMKLQKRLDELGYMFVDPTGEFGDATVQAIMDFQLLNGLEATGEVDSETLNLLFSSSAVPREE